MLKIYIFLLIMGIIGGVGYGGYAYYVDSQERMATLRTNNAKLLVANETKDATIATMLASQNQAQELNKALSKRLQVAEAYSDTLQAKFAKVNLMKSAIEDPYGLEGRINNAVVRLLDGLRADTDPNRVSGEKP